jgi:hypothetical protein
MGRMSRLKLGLKAFAGEENVNVAIGKTAKRQVLNLSMVPRE